MLFACVISSFVTSVLVCFSVSAFAHVTLPPNVSYTAFANEVP